MFYQLETTACLKGQPQIWCSKKKKNKTKTKKNNKTKTKNKTKKTKKKPKKTKKKKKVTFDGLQCTEKTSSQDHKC